MRLLLLLMSLTLVSNSMLSQEPAWEKRHFDGAAGDPLPYQIIRPDKHPGLAQALVVFLHGAGERGTDNELQLVHGAKRLAEAAGLHGAVVVAPQCPWTDYWANVGRALEPVTNRATFDFAFRPAPTLSLAAVIKLIDSLAHTTGIDSTQIHLIGISMGGMGILELAARFPGRFTSFTSIAGTYGAQVAPLLAQTPKIRFYHGGQDDVVPVAMTRELVKQIERAGAKPIYIEFPTANHNSWDAAFAEEDFWSWVIVK